jgi:hypothetical protein
MHFKNQLQLKNQLSHGPSPRRTAINDDKQARSSILVVANAGAMRAASSKAHGRHLRSNLKVVDRPEGDLLANRDATIQNSFERAASWHSKLARRFVAMIRAIRGFAVRSQTAFSKVLLAVISWTVAQILSSCAEYCQAMYPTFPDELVEARKTDADQLQGSGAAARGRTMPSLQSQFGAIATIDAQAVVCGHAIHVQDLTRLEIKRSISFRWEASITSPVAEFWLRLRRKREWRRKMMAPRALDDSVLWDVRRVRFPSEFLTSPGDHCE